MKYLKRYNESSEDINEVIQTLRDICHDITDDGRFSVAFLLHTSGTNEMLIGLKDPKDYDGFTLKEVEDVLQRIYDYLDISRYMGCAVLKVGEQHRSAMKYLTYDDRITNIKITFKE